MFEQKVLSEVVWQSLVCSWYEKSKVRKGNSFNIITVTHKPAQSC